MTGIRSPSSPLAPFTDPRGEEKGETAAGRARRCGTCDRSRRDWCPPGFERVIWTADQLTFWERRGLRGSRRGSDRVDRALPPERSLLGWPGAGQPLRPDGHRDRRAGGRTASQLRPPDRDRAASLARAPALPGARERLRSASRVRLPTCDGYRARHARSRSSRGTGSGDSACNSTSSRERAQNSPRRRRPPRPASSSPSTSRTAPPSARPCHSGGTGSTGSGRTGHGSAGHRDSRFSRTALG